MGAGQLAGNTGSGDHPLAGSGSEWERFILSGDFAEAEDIETVIKSSDLCTGPAAAVPNLQK